MQYNHMMCNLHAGTCLLEFSMQKPCNVLRACFYQNALRLQAVCESIAADQTKDELANTLVAWQYQAEMFCNDLQWLSFACLLCHHIFCRKLCMLMPVQLHFHFCRFCKNLLVLYVSVLLPDKPLCCCIWHGENALHASCSWLSTINSRLSTSAF